jgi:undecaprenyl-diphosphatase
MSPHRELLNYFLLGIVQGVTEFLPISSDGHLVILGRCLATQGDELTVVVLLHLGSLGALLWSFRRELLSIVRPAVGVAREGALAGPRLLVLLVLATLPAVIVGPLAERFFSVAFQSVPLAAAMLIVTGLVLLATRYIPLGTGQPTARSALAMGLAQVLALLPGVSRSATTLATGFAAGLEREVAARFAFLMAIPAIAGAAVFELRHLDRLRDLNQVGVAIGIVTAFLCGLGAIRILLKLVGRGRFEWFGVYCVVLGLTVLVLTRM